MENIDSETKYSKPISDIGTQSNIEKKVNAQIENAANPKHEDGLIKLIEVDIDHVKIVYEKEGKNLKEFYNLDKKGIISPDEANEMPKLQKIHFFKKHMSDTIDILKGLYTKSGNMHNDLNPSNIFLRRTGNSNQEKVILGDIDSMTNIDRKREYLKELSTKNHLCVSLIEDGDPSYKTDLLALGYTMMNIFLGNTKFNEYFRNDYEIDLKLQIESGMTLTSLKEKLKDMYDCDPNNKDINEIRLWESILCYFIEVSSMDNPDVKSKDYEILIKIIDQ